MNLNFIKSFIESDFISIGMRKNSRISNIFIKDPFLVNRELKQFLRCLRLLDKNSLSLLYMWVENRYTLTLVTRILNQTSTSIEVKVSEHLPLISKSYSQKILLSIENSKNNKTLLNRSLENKIFLLIRLNNQIESKISSIYSVHSEINDLKQICFIMILIRCVLSIKK